MNSDLPRSSWQLITSKSFAPFFWGKLASNSGIWVFNVGVALLIFDITGSPFFVGLVSVVLFGPQLVLTVFTGSYADRGNYKNQFLLGRFLSALGPAVLAIYGLIVGLQNIPVVVILLATATMGVGTSVGGPAMQAMIPELVKPTELANAVMLDNFTVSVGRAIGPVIGGFLAASSFLPGFEFVVSALLQLSFLILIAFFVRTDPANRLLDLSPRVIDGVRYLLLNRTILIILIGIAAVGYGSDPVMTLLPSIVDQMQLGKEFVGIFASAFGLGALLIFFVQQGIAHRIGETKMPILGLSSIGFGTLGLIYPVSPILTGFCFFLTGVGMSVSMTFLGIELFKRVDPKFRGRVMAFWYLAFLGTRPLSAFINGLLAEQISVAAALVTTSVLVLCIAWICRPAIFKEKY